MKIQIKTLLSTAISLPLTVGAFEPIPVDEYTSVLNELGLPISSIDNVPYNPETKRHESSYSPPLQILEAASIHNMVYSYFDPDYQGVKFMAKPDPYGFSDNITPLENDHYIYDQKDLDNTAEQVEQMRFGSYVNDRISYVDLRPTIEGLNGGVFQTPVKVVLEANDATNSSQIRIRYMGYNVTLKKANGSSSFELSSNDFWNSKNQIVATFVDNDGDGYDELLSVGFNGCVYTYDIREIENNHDEFLTAVYQNDILDADTSGVKGYLQLKAADISDKKAGEELLIFSRGPKAHSYNTGYATSKLRVLSAGVTGYVTLLNTEFSDELQNEKSVYMAPQTFATGNFNPEEPRKQVAFGIGDKGDNELRVEVYALNESYSDGKLSLSERLFTHDNNKGKWKNESFDFQQSMDVADLLGIGQDYIGFASNLYVYDSTKQNLVIVKSYNLGGDSSQVMTWTSGHFADDFNEYTATDINIVKPLQSVRTRKEGEEFVLTWVDVDSHKMSISGMQLIDIDNNIFEEVETNIEGEFYGSLSGVREESITDPLLLGNSAMMINNAYHRSKPTVAAYDAKDVSVILTSTGTHSVNFSQPVLTHVVEPVPFYGENIEEQDPSRILFLSQGQDHEYSSSSTVTSGVAFDVVIPMVSVGLSHTIGQIQGHSQSINIEKSVYQGDSLGTSPLLRMEVIPFDRYGYKMVKGPNQLDSMIGTNTDILIPRLPEVITPTLEMYNIINSDNHLFSYDHLFNTTAGNLESYPSSMEIREKYSGRVVFSDSNNISKSQGDTELGSSLTIGNLSQETSGVYTENSVTYSLGISGKGFGFESSTSFSRGLESSITVSSSRELTIESSLEGFIDDYPSYQYGSYLVRDKNQQGTEEGFIRGGFWVE